MIDLLAQPDCQDIAWGWILTLFGTDGSSCADKIQNAANVNTPYANAFSVLTAALAFFGGLMMAYHTIAGIVSSAYSGKVLGERWHQIWAPLRVVLGFGLLIPVGNGFSSIHYILRDVVGVAAINLANGIITVYVGSAENALTNPTTSSVTSLAGADFANKFFRKDICAGVISNMSSSFFTIWPYKASIADKAIALAVSGTGSLTGYTWSYGDCGDIVLTDYTVNADSGLFSTDAAQKYVTAFNLARYNAAQTLEASVKGIVDYDALGKFVDQYGSSLNASDAAAIKKLRESKIISTNIQSQLDQAAATYNKAVGTAATALFKSVSVDNLKGTKADLPAYGFMVAGSYERSLSAISSVVSGVANATLGETNPDFDEKTNKKIQFVQSVVTSSKATDNSGTGDSASDGNTDVITNILASIVPPPAVNADNMYTQTTSADPVGDMIMFGNNLLSTASWSLITIWGVKAVADGFGGSLAGLVGAASTSSLAGSVASWVAYLIGIMIIVGLAHSFVIPMIPMIMVFTMGVSWLVMFLEGSIAGVLWAFIFIRMDGAEFVDQKQSSGVGLLFNLLLRPALGMLAFCGMILLLPAILNALNQVWASAFKVQTGNHGLLSLVWLWQWAAGLVMFCWMQFNITMRIAHLIPTIADRVGGWMGINGSGYNDAGEHGMQIAGMISATNYIAQNPLTGGKGGGGRYSGPPPGGIGGGGGGRSGGGGGSNIANQTNNISTSKGEKGEKGNNGEKGEKGSNGESGRR